MVLRANNLARHRRPPRHVRLRGQPLRGRLQPLLPGQGRAGHGRPGLLPGPRRARHLRPRLPRGPPDRGPAGPLPAGGRARPGPQLVSPPAPDARLLGVPHGLDGPRAAGGHLPGALQPLPRTTGAQGHQRQPRLGVPGRRRDGRAGVARRPLDRRPRGPRQPDLRRQLQPAAPRRPGARQRQDRPGAGGRLPRRRLERHQGHLGPRVGRAAGPRRRRRARPPHGRDARRRVAEVLGRVGRLHPRALLRDRPAAAGAGRRPQRRRPDTPAPRRPRHPQAVRRVPRRARPPAGRPRSSWPRPSRAGRSAPASRLATSPTRRRSSRRRS